jgi:hypothetical protein
MTNGLPKWVAAMTNGLPKWVAAMTNGLPKGVAIDLLILILCIAILDGG